MSSQSNKDVVIRYFDERWNQNNLAVCDELLAPGVDIEAAKEYVRAVSASLGSMRLTFPDILADGDQVALHWRVEAIHIGEFLGVPPTGKPVAYSGIALLRLVDGKIVEDIAYWDNLAILEQLGAVPAPSV
ncbi:MAG: ester cyclase [Caldilineaceae bacterium]